MNFGIKNPEKLNGTIYNAEGTPILVLDNADGEIYLKDNTINIRLEINDEGKEEILNLFEQEGYSNN